MKRALLVSPTDPAQDAAEALRLGLVNRVVPAAELEATVSALAQRMAGGPTRAYGHLKRLMRQSLDRDLGAQLDAERDAFLDCTTTADFSEGIAAFVAKRKPQFGGR